MAPPADGLSHPAAAVVAHIVSETLQCAVRRVVPILGYGLINAVFRVDTTTAPLIVRLNQLGHLASYRKEQWCLRQAEQHGIPVPTVLAVGTADDRAFMIQAAIPGTSGATVGVDASQVWLRLVLLCHFERRSVYCWAWIPSSDYRGLPLSHSRRWPTSCSPFICSSADGKARPRWSAI